MKISQSNTYEEHLNKHSVIHLNMQEYASSSHSMHAFISLLTQLLMRELKKVYENIDYFDDANLRLSLRDIYNEKNAKFIFIIDEWDCIFREYKEDINAQKQYLDF